jgi:hypothetical protein
MNGGIAVEMKNEFHVSFETQARCSERLTLMQGGFKRVGRAIA